MLGLNIFRKARGIAIARAIREMFVRLESFRNAFIEIARARVITKRNQSRIIIFQRYFISMKIRAKARAKEKMIEMKFGFASSFGVSRPKGRVPSVSMISPVLGSIVEEGPYAFTTKSPRN